MYLIRLRFGLGVNSHHSLADTRLEFPNTTDMTDADGHGLLLFTL